MVLDVNQEVNLRLNADNRGLISGTRGAVTEIGKLNTSFVGLDKTITSNQSNLNNLKFSFDNLGQSASNFNQTIVAVPNSITKLESSTSGAASAVEAFNNANNIFLRLIAPKQVKTFETLTNVLNPVAKLHTDLNERTTTLGKSVELLGKVIVPFNKIIDTTQNTLKNVKESVRGINVLGIDLYETLDKFDKKLEFGQKLANFAVTADNARESISNFKEELGLFSQSVAETTSAVAASVPTMIPILQTMGPQLLGTLDGIGKKVGNVWLSMLGKLAKAFGVFQFQVMPFVSIFKSIGDSSILLNKQINELYKGFETFNNLGVDTSLAAMADEMGTLGENLVFNIAKTKEFVAVSMQLAEQFNAQVQYIRTLSAAQAYSVKELSGKLRDAVNDDLKNVVTAGELAMSVYDNVSAGIGTAAGQIGEAVKQANAAVLLAKPTGASIQETQRLINFVSTAYKYTASQAQEVASVLYQVVEQGVTNVSELAANMGEVASTASAVGLDLRNVSQAVAIATKTLGGDAYIAIKRLVESLSSMAPQSKKALQELGVTVDAQTLKTKGLFETMKEIYKASQGNIETLRNIIPESIAFQGALTLMTASTEDAANMMNNFNNASADSLQKLFDDQTESLTIRAERVRNSIQEVFTAAGQDLIDSGLFEQPMKAMEAFAERLQNMPEPVKNFIGSIIILNQTIEKITTIVGTFLSSLVAIGLQLTFLYAFTRGGKLFGAIKDGFMDTVKAAELAGEKVNYFKAALSGFGNIKNQVSKDFGFIFNIVNQFVSKIYNSFKSVYDALGNITKTVLTGNVSEISKYITSSFSTFKDQLSTQQSAIKEVFTTIGKSPEIFLFKENIKDMFAQSKQFAANFFTYLKEFNFKDLKSNFLAIGGALKNSFTSGTSAVKVLNGSMLDMFKNTKLGSVVFGSLNGIMAGSQAVMTAVGSTAKIMWTSILAPALPLLAIVAVLGAIRDFIPAFGSATDKANQFANSLDTMRDSTGRVSSEVRNLQKELGEQTGQTAKKFDTFINTWIINPLKWIITFPGNLVRTLQNVIPKILGSIPIIGKPLQALAEGIVKGMRSVGDFINDLGTGFKYFTDNLSKKIPVIGGLFKGLGEVVNGVSSFIASLTGQTEKLNTQITSFQNNIENMVDKKAVNSMYKFLDETDKKTKQLQSTLAQTTSSNPFEGLSENAQKNLDEYNKAITEYIGTLSDTNDEDKQIKERLQERLSNKQKETKAFLDSEKEYQSIIQKAREEDRSLTAEETTKINNIRKTAFEYRKTMIKDELSLLEENYEKMKEINAVEAEQIQKRIQTLNEQLTLEEKRQEILNKQTQTLNEFTKQINRDGKSITDLIKESNKSLIDQSTSLSKTYNELSKDVNNANKDQKQMLQTNIEATQTFQNLVSETNNFANSIEKSGSKINYFQQRTLNGFIGSIKDLGLSIDDINSENFDPAEFRSKIQTAVENSMDVMEQFGDNPEMTKKILETLKNTQIAYLDETGKVVKTTLEKTLTPEQLQELIEVRLQVIDNLTNKEIEKLNQKNIELEDKNKEHFSKMKGLDSEYSENFEKSRLELLDKQNKNNRKGRELEIKAAQEKLKVIETEFGKETDQYKEQYKKLLELQRNNKDETLNEQKNLLDQRLELFEKYQEKERIALETSLEQGNLSSLQFNEQNKKLTEDNFKEKEKKLEAEIELARKNGESILDLENELSRLRLDKIKEMRNAELQILEDKFEQTNNRLQKEALNNRLDAIDGESKQELQIRIEQENSELETKRQYLIEQMRLYGKNSDERKKLEMELKELEVQMAEKAYNDKKAIMEKEFNLKVAQIDKLLEIDQRSAIDGTTSQEIDKTEKLETDKLNLRKDFIKQQIALTQEGTEERLKLETELEQTITAIQSKEQEKRKRKIQEYFDDLSKSYENDLRKQQQSMLDGTNIKELDDANQLEESIIQIKIMSLKKQLSLYEQNSKEYKDIQQQILEAELNLQEKVITNKRNILDKQFELDQLYIEKNKSLYANIGLDGLSDQELKYIQDVAKQELEIKSDQLKQKIQLYEKDSFERLQLENELQGVLNEIQAKEFENRKEWVRRKYELAQSNLQKENILIEQQLVNQDITRETFETKQNENRKKANLLEQQYLSQQLNIYQKGTKEYYDTLNQLTSKQLEYQKLVLDESIQQLEKQKQQININTESSKQSIEKLSQAQDRYISNLEFESKMKQTDLDITKTLMNAEISRLELSLNQTGDIVEKAQINLQIKQKQIEISNKEIQIQMDNLAQQQTINKLNLEKEQIQIRLNKLDIERNILQTKLEIKQAKLQNKSKEELQILEQQLDSLNNQTQLLGQREQDLIRNNQLEQQISNNKMKELEIQKEINKEKNQNEIEIAQQQKLLAILEKQKETVLYRYEKSIQAQEKELQSLDHIQKVEENRLKALQQRQSTLNELMGLFENASQMSSEDAVSEAKKEHIAKKTAEMKYRMLQISQNIERQNLEMEMKQAEIANKRLQIEHERAKLTAQSNLKQAEFDAKKVLMDKNASSLDKQRAMDLVQSRKDELVILDQQGSLIQESINLTNQSFKDRRNMLDFKQGLEDLQGQKEIARTTRNTADDAAISQQAGQMANVLEKTLVNNMKQFEQLQTPTIEINKKMEETLRNLNKTIENSNKVTKEQPSNSVSVGKLADITVNLTDNKVSGAVPDIKREIYGALESVVTLANQQNITPTF